MVWVEGSQYSFKFTVIAGSAIHTSLGWKIFGKGHHRVRTRPPTWIVDSERCEGCIDFTIVFFSVNTFE